MKSLRRHLGRGIHLLVLAVSMNIAIWLFFGSFFGRSRRRRERWDIRITWRDVIINRQFTSTLDLAWRRYSPCWRLLLLLEVCFFTSSFVFDTSFIIISFSFFWIRFKKSSLVIFINPSIDVASHSCQDSLFSPRLHRCCWIRSTDLSLALERERKRSKSFCNKSNSRDVRAYQITYTEHHLLTRKSDIWIYFFESPQHTTQDRHRHNNNPSDWRCKSTYIVDRRCKSIYIVKLLDKTRVKCMYYWITVPLVEYTHVLWNV